MAWAIKTALVQAVGRHVVGASPLWMFARPSGKTPSIPSALHSPVSLGASYTCRHSPVFKYAQKEGTWRNTPSGPDDHGDGKSERDGGRKYDRRGSVETPDGSIIIPISRVGFGFAAGDRFTLDGPDRRKGQTDEEKHGREKGTEFPSAGKREVSITPVAFLVVGERNPPAQPGRTDPPPRPFDRFAPD